MAEALLIQTTGNHRLNASGNKIITNAGACTCAACTESTPLSCSPLYPTEFSWPDTRVGSVDDRLAATYDDWTEINMEFTWGVTPNSAGFFDGIALAGAGITSYGRIRAHARSGGDTGTLTVLMFSTLYDHTVTTVAGDKWTFKITRLGVGSGTQNQFWVNGSILEDRTDATKDMTNGQGCSVESQITCLAGGTPQDPMWWTGYTGSIT